MKTSVSYLKLATKCISKNHGYDNTLKGVDESLAKFGLGKSAPW